MALWKLRCMPPNRQRLHPATEGIPLMPRNTLEALIVVLILLWLLGWLAFPVGGNLIHLLLVLVLIVVLIRVLQGRRPVP
jgi:hypothetical protein